MIIGGIGRIAEVSELIAHVVAAGALCGSVSGQLPIRSAIRVVTERKDGESGRDGGKQ